MEPGGDHRLGLLWLTNLSVGRMQGSKSGRYRDQSILSSSAPNLEHGAGHLWMCPLPWQLRSLCPGAGNLVWSECGLNHSGPSPAGALE
jgi:hypothetical protein